MYTSFFYMTAPNLSDGVFIFQFCVYLLFLQLIDAVSQRDHLEERSQHVTQVEISPVCLIAKKPASVCVWSCECRRVARWKRESDLQLTHLVSLSLELLAVVVLHGLQVVQPLPQLLGLVPGGEEPDGEWTVSRGRSSAPIGGWIGGSVWILSPLTRVSTQKPRNRSCWQCKREFTSVCRRSGCRCSGVCTSPPWSSSSSLSPSASCLSSPLPEEKTLTG